MHDLLLAEAFVRAPYPPVRTLRRCKTPVQDLTYKTARWAPMDNNMCWWNAFSSLFFFTVPVKLRHRKSKIYLSVCLSNDRAHLCGSLQVSTGVPPPQPYVALVNVFLCRPATPAAASRGSSSARCRPTASVSNRQGEVEGDGN